MGFISHLKKLDWWLVVIVAIIVGLGIASFYNIGSRSPDFMQRQAMFLVFGIAVMLAVSFFDYRILKNFSSASIAFYLLAIVLLLFALASQEIRGVSSWIIFKNFTFEPVELAKFSLIILLAKYFSQKHVEIYHTRHILASAVYALIPAALTFTQPDLGSVIVLISIWLAMLLFSGIKRNHLLVILMVGIVISTIGWFAVLKPYQKDRLTSFINPYLDPRGSGYNILQAKTSIGSGQWFGIAFNKKASQRALVPEPYNDFTFANFARKFGFAGITVLIIMFLLLMFRIGSIATRTDNNFAKLFSLGFLTLIFAHVSINAGVNLGLLPITGIPFSFLSYGGSHLVTLMMGLGIIQNIRVSSRN
ncbi:MAG: rod shape-determining protein RodA [Candidatus Yanofskybacteria bacterium]|nr:rod shape-determining protein RodA [Candidatus Yanofskybacteria bacterium]